MEITGVLSEVFETMNVSGTFRKREFVVEYAENPQYPELIKFELIQDKCELLDSFTKGQPVRIQFNLKGRKWINPKGEAVFFNSLQAWKLTVTQQEAGETVPAKTDGPPPYSDAPAAEPGQEEEVPF